MSTRYLRVSDSLRLALLHACMPLFNLSFQVCSFGFGPFGNMLDCKKKLGHKKFESNFFWSSHPQRQPRRAYPGPPHPVPTRLQLLPPPASFRPTAPTCPVRPGTCPASPAHWQACLPLLVHRQRLASSGIKSEFSRLRVYFQSALRSPRRPAGARRGGSRAPRRLLFRKRRRRTGAGSGERGRGRASKP